MQIELTRLFVKVIQHGSFSKAAASMNIPKSTVSKAVTRLETETGTKLLNRTTRSLTLTAAGRAFYDSCLDPILTLEEAQKSLYGQDDILAGTIRITAPEDLGSTILAPAVSELAKKHSALAFDLLFTDEIIDMVKDNFDFAVRIGPLRESNLKARPLGEFRLIAVASPSYLKSAGKITHPRDLESHECLTLGLTALRKKWILKSKNETYSASIRSRITVNHMTSLLQLAISGGGIAFVPQYLCQKALSEKATVQVLPEWHSPGLKVTLMSTSATSSSARLKLISDSLHSQIRKALE